MDFQQHLNTFLHTAKENGLAVISWQMPHENKARLILAKPSSYHKENIFATQKKGFLFSPFNTWGDKPIYFFEEIAGYKTGHENISVHPDCTETIKGSINNTKNKDFTVHNLPQKGNSVVSTPKKTYTNGVESIIESIKNGDVQKVVLAGKKFVPLSPEIEVFTLWETMCKKYPGAFISLVYLPSGELWMGATPELLVNVEKDLIRTIALASTQNGLTGKDVHWGEKDKHEQQIVSDYIEQCFRNAGINKFKHSTPKTINAGKLKHLQTEYLAPLDGNESKISAFVQLLHPTPAICGVPLEKAKQFIASLEENDRSFYAGFLGPVGYNNSLSQFVNLRCMTLYSSGALLYAGAGIVKDSKPEAEWNEIQLKFGTMLNIISSVLQ